MADQCCPDCHVQPGQPHELGCDTARCPACGIQRLQCDAHGDDRTLDARAVWTGAAPAVADDYRQRVAEAIAARFTYPVYRCDRDGENERVENPEPADRIGQTPYVRGTAGDGCRSFWTPTCAELAEVVAAVRDEDLEQLRYERRLLGAARMVLDLVAAGDASRWDQARQEAEDLAQRIVDEIGHPVTDEPALGPQWRERAETAEQEVARLRAGEASEPAPDGTWSTPPQWIRHWNTMPANVRLAMADQILRNAQAAHDCAMAHGLRAQFDRKDTGRG